MILKVIVYCSICASICDAKTYENYTLYRGIPVSNSHLNFFRNLSDLYGVNYWSLPGKIEMPVDFVIAPAQKKSFLKDADKNGIYLTTLMENVQSAFDMQTVKSYIRRRMDTFDWQNYYKIDDIYKWLKDLAMAFPNEVVLESIGKTYENRDILAVKICLRGSLHRSKVIIEGGIHAREWISPAFVTYMINRIVHSKKSPDKKLRTIANTYEWYFVPVVNPDGYEYTHTKDRLWRKNREKTGVDLNRNFGYMFGSTGISFNKETEIYCGEKAFSARESRALGRFVESKSEDLEYYLSFHSYGQFIIIPYAFSKTHAENYDETQEMGLRAAYKIRSLNNKSYAVGTAYDTVGYTVGGSSTCWVKKSFGVPYVMTFELRDEGNFGFALPTSQIIPTCEETLGGVLSVLTPNTKDIKCLKGYYQKYDSYYGLYSYIDGQEQTFLNKMVFSLNVLLIMYQILID